MLLVALSFINLVLLALLMVLLVVLSFLNHVLLALLHVLLVMFSFLTIVLLVGGDLPQLDYSLGRLLGGTLHCPRGGAEA